MTLLNPTTGYLEVLTAHGMVGGGYDFQVNANLDPTGRVAVFMSNKEGRMDAWLLVL